MNLDTKVSTTKIYRLKIVYIPSSIPKFFARFLEYLKKKTLNFRAHDNFHSIQI